MITDSDAPLEEQPAEPAVETARPAKDLAAAKTSIATRCKAAGIKFEEVIRGHEFQSAVRVGLKCERDFRWLYIPESEVVEFQSIPFENYVFLSGYEAICHYVGGTIEAAIRVSASGGLPSGFIYRKLFASDDPTGSVSLKVTLEPTQQGFPRIEISRPSSVFNKLTRLVPLRHRLSFKLSNCSLRYHDQALALLKKAAGSTFFQIDLLSDVSLTLERERRRSLGARRTRRQVNLAKDLQYPRTEFDDAPLSLYSYGRSASGMPLLQFLAFYQVIEFYFPTYSQAEAQRKLKAILKEPTFRGDRDADIGRLLASIYVNRRGTYGDERSQLRATLMECVAPDALRTFLECDQTRKEFYLASAKNLPYTKIPLANPTADLRGEVAERMYDIRCQIVHTKNDSRDGELELLLPFSKEADQLYFDIELAQYLAHAVLVAGSLPFQLNS